MRSVPFPSAEGVLCAAVLEGILVAWRAVGVWIVELRSERIWVHPVRLERPTIHTKTVKMVFFIIFIVNAWSVNVSDTESVGRMDLHVAQL
jgi:hypothetical protein